MKKQEQFELAKKMRDMGLKYKEVAQVVSSAANRKSTYSTSTMAAWCKYDTYREYADDMARKERERQAKNKENGQPKKEPTKHEEFDGTNSIVSVLKAIEYQQQSTNNLLERIVVVMEKIS